MHFTATPNGLITRFFLDFMASGPFLPNTNVTLYPNFSTAHNRTCMSWTKDWLYAWPDWQLTHYIYSIGTFLATFSLSLNPLQIRPSLPGRHVITSSGLTTQQSTGYTQTLNLLFFRIPRMAVSLLIILANCGSGSSTKTNCGITHNESMDVLF